MVNYKKKNEITDKYSNELRLCIQFAAPHNCEPIAINILKECITECFSISKKNKPEIK